MTHYIDLAVTLLIGWGLRRTQLSRWIPALARFFGSDCRVKPARGFLKYLIQKELVALTGIEPVFAAFSCFLNLLKPQSQGSPCSQESQPICTKHVHGIGQRF